MDDKKLTRSKHSRLRKVGKIFVMFLFVLFAIFFFIWLFFGRERIVQPDEIVWGVTYSDLAAEELGLDPEETYEAVVNDLQPTRLRLVAYWNRIEGRPDFYDFSELDRQVELAEKKGIEYFIAVGRRVPRYPECHAPDWVKNWSLEDQQEQIVKLIQKTIERYDSNEHLIAWQIENEPFVGSFGICPDLNEDFLAREIDLARRLTDKTIITSESGELSFWLKASKYPDVLGTTLYRVVIVGKSDLAVQHIFPPAYYRARSNIAQKIRGNLDKVIVAELQAEPWASKPLIEADPAQIERTMNPAQFEKNITFTESVGFPEVYFWGAEWWYYQLQQGNDYYWNRAQQLFD